MNIAQSFVQLRNDLKLWVTNNLVALNNKIDEKTIPIDSEIDSSSSNPVQNKAIAKAIDNIPRFSGNYEDLTNAPDIYEDDSGDLNILDENGNSILRVDARGLHTIGVYLSDKQVATQSYVDSAIEAIPTPDVSG